MSAPGCSLPWPWRRVAAANGPAYLQSQAAQSKDEAESHWQRWQRTPPVDRHQLKLPKKLTELPYRMTTSNLPRWDAGAHKYTAADIWQQYQLGCRMRYQWQQACFTDGSVLDGGKAGAAIYRAEGTGQAANSTLLRINPNGTGVGDTINRAELSAIYHSVHDVLGRHEDGTIFPDSQVALHLVAKMLRRPWALQRHPHRDLIRLIAECLVERANAGARTVLQKVPAHAGIKGNEQADAGAKEAAQLDDGHDLDTPTHTPFAGLWWPAFYKQVGTGPGDAGDVAPRPVANTKDALRAALHPTTRQGYSRLGVYATAW